MPERRDIPLYDPFLFPKPEPEAKRVPLSALLAFPTALLGPIGSALGVLLAWLSLREIAREPQRLKGRGWAFLAMGLSVFMLAAWTAGIFVFLPRIRNELRSMGVAPTAASSFSSPNNASANPSPPPLPALPLASGAPPSPSPAPSTRASAREASTGNVPPDTSETKTGGITVVDIGFSESSLSAALQVQQRAAEANGQTLMVMTVNSNCEPCEGVFASLPDPRMQSALLAVRLVRVNIEVFQDELDKLRIQRVRWPGFFLLGPDLSPRDAIDGGEWDDDIAANIAPVLDPFVRGRYEKRRDKFRPLPPTGVAL